tara:strand:+ start:2746 stop:3387 length:642 start_codon:yes stop_codon:yes gene_type:complete
MIKCDYNINDFKFSEIVQDIFNVTNLSKIHESIEHDKKMPTDASKDQKSSFHKIFYKTYEDPSDKFLPTYKSFVKHLSAMHYPDKKIIFQRRPTFRVHAPNNLAVAAWHKDKLYNHSPDEINVFLPMTDAFDTNTLWVESTEDKGDYSPMNAKYGEYVIWDGANLNHGNKKNETKVSRVSCDFRIIFVENFNYIGTSATQKVKMELGHYWEAL